MIGAMPSDVPRSRPRSAATPRSLNVERVLEVLRADGPSSQAHLARRTGLSPATVNLIVRRLREQGVAEVRRVNGREGVVALVTGSGTFVAVDVAHDRVRGTAFAFAERTRRDAEIATSSPAAAIELVERLAEEAGTSVPELAGVAVAMEAPIESSTDAIVGWCNSRLPAWAGVPLTSTFSAALGADVIVANDASFAALAEWTWGVGRGSEDFLYVTADQGVGGGVVINGSIYRGGTGMAGDIGHMALEETGDVCYCGNRGCLTTLISEHAIVGAVQATPGSSISTLGDVIDAARRGDAASQRVLAEAGHHLGRALANSAKVLAPSVIALGGALGAAGPLVFDGLLSSIEVTNMRAGSQSTRFATGHIHRDGSLLGGLCALLARSGMGVSALEPWLVERRD